MDHDDNNSMVDDDGNGNQRNSKAEVDQKMVEATDDPSTLKRSLEHSDQTQQLSQEQLQQRDGYPSSASVPSPSVLPAQSPHKSHEQRHQDQPVPPSPSSTPRSQPQSRIPAFRSRVETLRSPTQKICASVSPTVSPAQMRLDLVAPINATDSTTVLSMVQSSTVYSMTPSLHHATFKTSLLASDENDFPLSYEGESGGKIKNSAEEDEDVSKSAPSSAGDCRDDMAIETYKMKLQELESQLKALQHQHVRVVEERAQLLDLCEEQQATMEDMKDDHEQFKAERDLEWNEMTFELDMLRSIVEDQILSNRDEDDEDDEDECSDDECSDGNATKSDASRESKDSEDYDDDIHSIGHSMEELAEKSKRDTSLIKSLNAKLKEMHSKCEKLKETHEIESSKYQTQIDNLTKANEDLIRVLHVLKASHTTSHDGLEEDSLAKEYDVDFQNRLGRQGATFQSEIHELKSRLANQQKMFDEQLTKETAKVQIATETLDVLTKRCTSLQGIMEEMIRWNPTLMVRSESGSSKE